MSPEEYSKLLLYDRIGERVSDLDALVNEAQDPDLRAVELLLDVVLQEMERLTAR